MTESQTASKYPEHYCLVCTWFLRRENVEVQTIFSFWWELRLPSEDRSREFLYVLEDTYDCQ